MHYALHAQFQALALYFLAPQVQRERKQCAYREIVGECALHGLASFPFVGGAINEVDSEGEKETYGDREAFPTGTEGFGSTLQELCCFGLQWFHDAYFFSF